MLGAVATGAGQLGNKGRSGSKRKSQRRSKIFFRFPFGFVLGYPVLVFIGKCLLLGKNMASKSGSAMFSSFSECVEAFLVDV